MFGRPGSVPSRTNVARNALLAPRPTFIELPEVQKEFKAPLEQARPRGRPRKGQYLSHPLTLHASPSLRRPTTAPPPGSILSDVDEMRKEALLALSTLGKGRARGRPPKRFGEGAETALRTANEWRRAALRDLEAFLKEHSDELADKQLPPRSFLLARGRTDLAQTIKKLGGPVKVAALLGLAWRPKSDNYGLDGWEDGAGLPGLGASQAVGDSAAKYLGPRSRWPRQSIPGGTSYGQGGGLSAYGQGASAMARGGAAVGGLPQAPLVGRLSDRWALQPTQVQVQRAIMNLLCKQKCFLIEHSATPNDHLWQMWHVPLNTADFPTPTDGLQKIVGEAHKCAQGFRRHYVRVSAFDPRTQSQIATFVLFKPSP